MKKKMQYDGVCSSDISIISALHANWPVCVCVAVVEEIIAWSIMKDVLK